MTDARTSRTSVLVAAQPLSDAEVSRVSVLVAAQPLSDARVSRVSVLVAIATDEFGGGGTTPYAGWGMIPMGVS